VVISSTEILTAEHVIRGVSTVTTSVPGVGSVLATVRGWDKARDLALLTFTSGSFTPTEAFLPTEGMLIEGAWDFHGSTWDRIVAVGYVPSISETTPMSTFGSVGTAWAVYSTVDLANPDISKIGFDAAVAPGMSGGGVFDVHGHLAGIIQVKGQLGFDNRALRWTEIDEVLSELRAGARRP